MKSSDMPVQRQRVDQRSRRTFLVGSLAVATGALSTVVGGWPRKAQAANAPIWEVIPDQTWAVGVPVYLDLANYATSQIGAELLFTLNNSLPDGVSLNGSVISGTPTAKFSSQTYVATAQDGEIIESTPQSPANLIVE